MDNQEYVILSEIRDLLRAQVELQKQILASIPNPPPVNDCSTPCDDCSC
jgi:hypothetical protein